MARINEYIRILFDECKFARRFSLFWAMGLVTYVVVSFFERPDFMEAPQASVVIAFVGVLTTVIGFYQWHRSKDLK